MNATTSAAKTAQKSLTFQEIFFPAMVLTGLVIFYLAYRKVNS